MSGLFVSVLVGAVLGYLFYRKRHQESGPEAGEEEPVVRSRPAHRSFSGDSGEIREAIEAGEQALSSLRTAKERLNSARMWGVADLLGGGFITGMVKHESIRSANQWIDSANNDLRRFARELRDVAEEGLYVETGDLAAFLDIFFDNFISDFLMQNRINEARNQLDQVMERVQNTVLDLKTAENSSDDVYRGTAYAAAAGDLPVPGETPESVEEDYDSSPKARYLE